VLPKGMHEAWVQFVRTGDPGGPRYDVTERATQVFDETSAMVIDAGRLRRLAS